MIINGLMEGLKNFFIPFRVLFSKAYDIHGDFVFFELTSKSGKLLGVNIDWWTNKQDDSLFLSLVLSMAQSQLNGWYKEEELEQKTKTNPGNLDGIKQVGFTTNLD